MREPSQVSNPVFPGDAGVDASDTTSNATSSTATTGKTTGKTSDDDGDPTSEEVSDAGAIGETMQPNTSGTDAGSVDTDPPLGIGCMPTQCVCPDPMSEDCCHELLPYRTEVLATPEEIAANTGGMIDPDDLPPVPTVTTLTKEDLWTDFSAGCGTNSGCHVGTDRGPDDPLVFQVTFETFDARPTLGQESLQRVQGMGGTAMPVGAGDDATKRTCSNLWVRLGEALLAYQNSGWKEKFDVPRCPEDIAAEEAERENQAVGTSACDLKPHPYALEATLALAQTNLGQCIPNHIVSCPEADLKAQDVAFAGYQSSDDLPTSIRGTDLVSLDSEVLAKHRVFSYSPTYTLFSDNAKKQRYVRVPVGQKITYNSETHDFDIPENTRFYKTFLKPVINEAGETHYRKVETRLIVARRNAYVNGVSEIRSLRATYAWDNEEREAKRVTDQRKDGTPWADRLCPIVVNQTLSRDEEAHPVVTSNREECKYMTDEELQNPESGLVRHYAIPGSQRCDECHMGANNRSYILGFSPWAADHRPMGEGGVFEKPHADELTQLQRLLANGVLEGIQPGEAKLEESQGEKVPRSEYELKAQAYMIGNCAYCHNPNGFPTVQNPVLKGLNFYPQADGSGGIFQFPLDKESPRARTGRAQVNPIRYITTQWGAGQIEGSYKEEEKVMIPGDYSWIEGTWPDFDLDGELQFLAPWRSLIWRNVYTPFTYPDDSAIYIHMPRNVPGFDCRAHNIMADWMLSISVNDSGEELQPGENGLADANAKRRVEAYHAGVTGQQCPTDDDILEPAVLQHLRSAPRDTGDLNSSRINREAILGDGVFPVVDMFADAVPDHAHWVTTDFSTPADHWEPKRSGWKDVLLGNVPPDTEALGAAIEDINTVHLSPEQEEFSLEDVPLGLWADRCTDQVPTGLATKAATEIANVNSDNRWVKYGPFDLGIAITDEREVHSMSRGQAVFELICQNCHGVNYDSKSPLAQTVGELSGGGAIVANFRSGLFGPESSPGAFANAEFTFSEGNTGASAEEWQARYLLFMGLGGTQATIPQEVLSLISSSPFYGQAASTVGVSDGTTFGANMLQPAQAKCVQILTTPITIPLLVADKKFHPIHDMTGIGTPFAVNTGHYQLWESLCNYGQAPMVRVLNLEGAKLLQGTTLARTFSFYSVDRLGRPLYPSDALVGDQLGQVTPGIQPGNVLPWCVSATDAQKAEIATTYGFPENQVPWCPAELLSTVQEVPINEVPGNVVLGLQDGVGKERWLRKGAMNAGIAAFYYMDRRAKGVVTPTPRWDSDACGGQAMTPTTPSP